MFTGNEDQSITLSAGASLTAKWRLVQGSLAPLGQYYSKYSLNQLLSQDGAVGVRVYFGMTSDVIPKLTLVIVAVTADGNDITSLVVDTGSACPPNCSVSNSLNSGS